MYFLESKLFFFCDGDKLTKKILLCIKRCDFEKANDLCDFFLDEIILIKNSESVSEIKNEIYVVEQFIQLLSLVSGFWKDISMCCFSNSWCVLQDILTCLRKIKKFNNKENMTTAYFERQFLALEATYPYTIFFSVGIVVDYYNCSICDHDIDSFECEHLRGELYDGDIAIGIVKNILHFDHCAIVEKPLDKRCVMVIDDDSELFGVQKSLSNYIDKKKLTPLSFQKIEVISFKKENPEYVLIPRNSLCFCGSGKKFKKCCISKKTIEHKHFEFINSDLIA